MAGEDPPPPSEEPTRAQRPARPPEPATVAQDSVTRAQERAPSAAPVAARVEEAGVAATPQKPAPPVADPDHLAAPPRGWIGQLKGIGGLVALTGGLVAIVLVVFIVVEIAPGQATGVATGAITAIGAMVGAYFGVKIGTDGTSRAVEAMRQESAKAQAYALGVPDHQAATRAIAHAAKLMHDQGIDAEGLSR
jgi:hypothetical protein